MEKIELDNGRIVLYWGDCLDVMPALPPKSVDMVLADLPYGISTLKWDSVLHLPTLWRQYYNVSGLFVLTGTQPFISSLVSSNLNDYKYSWYWKKNVPSGFQLAKYQPMRIVEEIAIFYKHIPTYNPQMRKTDIADRKVNGSNKNGGGGTRSPGVNGNIKKQPSIMREFVYPYNFLEFSVPERSKGTLHPTQKPVALMEYLIKTYTNEDMLVMDNTMGSGTTGVACINTGRRFVGIEKEEKYFRIALTRCEEALQKINGT